MDDKAYIQKRLIYKILIDTQIHLSAEKENGKIVRAKWELIDSLYDNIKEIPETNLDEINFRYNKLD